MAATTDRYERLDSETTATTVTFTHQRRASLNDAWADAEVVSRETFSIEDIALVLVNGSGEISLAVHGLSTVMQQRGSDTKDTATKLAEYVELYHQLLTGVWRAPAQARTKQVDPKLVQALVIVKGCTLMEAQVTLNLMTVEQRETFASSEAIVEALAVIKDELASVQALNVDDLLA